MFLSPGYPILSGCWSLPQPWPSAGEAGRSPQASLLHPAALTCPRGRFNGRGFLTAHIQAFWCRAFWDVRLDLETDISVTVILFPWQTASFAHLTQMMCDHPQTLLMMIPHLVPR